MGSQLTKKADFLMCLIYKKYSKDIKSGISISEAKQLGSSTDIQKAILPKWSPEDVDDICCELGEISFLNNFHADDIVYSSQLTPAGITFMENRFKGNLKAITEYIFKLAKLII